MDAHKKELADAMAKISAKKKELAAQGKKDDEFEDCGKVTSEVIVASVEKPDRASAGPPQINIAQKDLDEIRSKLKPTSGEKK